MHLMLSLCDTNKFYNTYYIKKDEINTTRSNFGDYISYGSRFWTVFIGHNIYTLPRRCNREMLPLFKELYLKTTKMPL